MSDPFQVLNLPHDSDDDAIRRRYLELVKQYPPGQHPEKFAQVRQAYEMLKDLTTRVRHRLFEAGEQDTIEKMIEELSCLSPRRRVSLKSLLSLARKPT